MAALYADDVLLLSQSVQVMQNMLDICGSYAGDFDVKFNCVKSVAMRILSGCFSCVKWNNVWSCAFDINFGIRQGSVLSPFVCSVYR